MSRFADDDDSGNGSYESSTDSDAQAAQAWDGINDADDEDDDLVQPEPCMSLFTGAMHADPEACVAADAEQFGLDLAQCFAGVLDAYERIKLVNFVRGRVKALQHPGTGQQYATRAELLDALKAAPWSLPARDAYADDSFLVPVLADDALLVWAASYGERDGDVEVGAVMTQAEQDEIEARVRADVDMAALEKAT